MPFQCHYQHARSANVFSFQYNMSSDWSFSFPAWAYICDSWTVFPSTLPHTDPTVYLLQLVKNIHSYFLKIKILTDKSKYTGKSGCLISPKVAPFHFYVFLIAVFVVLAHSSHTVKYLERIVLLRHFLAVKPRAASIT